MKHMSNQGDLKLTIRNYIKAILNYVGYAVISEAQYTELLGGKDFLNIYPKCKPHSMVSLDRSLGLYRAIEYIHTNRIEGDFVECGVWKGGQSMLMALSLLSKEDTCRDIWLFDTYKGMSEPTEHDVYIKKGPEEGTVAKVFWKDQAQGDHNEWAYAPLDEVKRNMESTGYPSDKFKYIVGKVEDTIPHDNQKKIALLRLDTDWYESTLHELTHLCPQLVSGGILIIDDYNSWKGSKKAVDEYVTKTNVKMNWLDIGSARFGIKLC